MSRSSWAAAGACALALATMPGVALARGGGSSPHLRGGKTPTAANQPSGRPHPNHSENNANKRRATRAWRRHGSVLALGTGYQQAAGSDRVRSLQRSLAHLGFAPGPIDGRYGPLTAAAVARMQAAADLAVDGVAGPHTQAMVDNMTHAELAPGAGYRQPGGSQGVRAVQRRLLRLGFAPGRIDGRYGPLTTRAICRFQLADHQTVSGVIGARTFVAREPARRHVPTTRRTPAAVPAVSPPRLTVVGRPQPRTPLPVGLVLLALAAFGAAVAAYSYWTTRLHIQAIADATPPRRPGPPPARGVDAPGRGAAQ